MSPEKVQVVLLVLNAVAFFGLGWQARARARFDRWVRAQQRRQQGALRRSRQRQRRTQLAHERLAELVRELDLRVPKKPTPGWGTMLDDAETRVLGARETYPAIDLGAIAASRRQ
jgi:hypothetical protein